jgi:uncharacterized glyoxalase superfamily protein PhnB
MNVQAYISYRGRCEEALEFYKKSIGADRQVRGALDGECCSAQGLGHQLPQ